MEGYKDLRTPMLDMRQAKMVHRIMNLVLEACPDGTRRFNNPYYPTGTRSYVWRYMDMATVRIASKCLAKYHIPHRVGGAVRKNSINIKVPVKFKLDWRVI